jgi:hypothetical protein
MPERMRCKEEVHVWEHNLQVSCTGMAHGIPPEPCVVVIFSMADENALRAHTDGREQTVGEWGVGRLRRVLYVRSHSCVKSGHKLLRIRIYTECYIR